jgi:hypothetical protein
MARTKKTKEKCARCNDTGEEIHPSEHPYADDTCSCSAGVRLSEKSTVSKVYVFPDNYPKTRFIEESWEEFPWKDKMSRQDYENLTTFFLEQFMNRYP